MTDVSQAKRRLLRNSDRGGEIVEMLVILLLRASKRAGGIG